MQQQTRDPRPHHTVEDDEADTLPPDANGVTDPREPVENGDKILFISGHNARFESRDIAIFHVFPIL